MQSPLFFGHLSILVLVAANLIVAARWLRRTNGDAAGRASPGGVLRRGSSLVYAVASALTLVVTGLLFLILEVSDDARAHWRASARWHDVQPGMTARQVVDRLGPPPSSPRASDLYAGEEIWAYQLHPLGALDEGYLAFATGDSGGPTLLRKLPSDEVWEAVRSSWLPEGYTRSRYRRTSGEIAGFTAFCGLFVLAIVTVLPFRPRRRWQSWTLYTPLLALFLGAVYEANASEGWRFDLFLIVPAYMLITLGWVVRFAAWAWYRAGVGSGAVRLAHGRNGGDA